MANKDDRTEEPTAKRRGEARKKGQVAKSTDLNAAVVLIAGLVMVAAIGPSIPGNVAEVMRYAFGAIAHPGAALSAGGLHGLQGVVLHALIAVLAPIAGVCLVAGILVNIATTGLKPTTYPLKPTLSRLNPANGAKNIFGSRIPFELGKNIAKVAAVGAVAAMSLVPQIRSLGAGVGVTPGALGSLMKGAVLSMAARVVAAYLLIGIVDYAWQRRRNEKSLKMTKQEVKEEARQYSLPPEVRSAIKRRQIQAARARMMAAVPQADVVVTNPTHYAVALKYDGSAAAPEVIAKGQDLVAAQIRRIAEENDVPIVPDPPLARALHAAVEVGELVPEQLWGAVAQVLAFVYRVAGRRKVALS